MIAILAYDFVSVIAFGGLALTALTLIYSIFHNRATAKRLKRPEDRRLEIESRGKAPYFVPSSKPFQVTYNGEDGRVYLLSDREGYVLCWSRKKVADNIADGDTVILPLDNQGETPRTIKIESELKDCVLRQGAELKSEHGRSFLQYQYERALQGKPAELTIKFELSDGYWGTHTYKTVHGEFVFERIDPP